MSVPTATQMSLVSTGSERARRAVRYASITSSADMSGTALAIHRRMPSSSSAMRAGLPNPNRVSSSRLVPISRSTPAAPPFATAAKGCSGRNTPSTTGRKGSGIMPWIRAPPSDFLGGGDEFGCRYPLQRLPVA